VRAPGRGKRKLSISRRDEVRTLLLIGAGITIPLAAAVFAISETGRPDLSDLVPIKNSAQNYVLLNWSTLLRDHPGSLVAGSSLFVGSPVQALGYMVESDHVNGKGEWARDFVLLPEAGNLLHPAHRFGDQMITVHLAPEARVLFSRRGSRGGLWFGYGEHFEPAPAIRPARSLFTHLSARAFKRPTQRKSGSISNDRDPMKLHAAT
jgi:hypothetical protein